MNDSVITKNRRETVIEITGSENSLPNKSNEIKRKKVSFAPLRKLSVPQPNSPIQKNTLHSSPICQSTPIEQFTDSHFEFTKSRLDSKEIKHIQNLCQIIRLPDIEKHILEHRYIPMLQSYEKHYRSYCVVFKLFHCIVQTGSLIVPALLTIEQYYNQCDQTSAIFWATWGISLMVGLVANYLKLFKIDKKHYTLKNTYYNLLSIKIQSQILMIMEIIFDLMFNPLMILAFNNQICLEKIINKLIKKKPFLNLSIKLLINEPKLLTN